MELFNIITLLVVVSALFAYINKRYVNLPYTIGAMIITIAMSIILTLLGWLNPHVINPLLILINKIDFSTVLLEIMLSFLLFAGALHTNFEQLQVQRRPILLFSTFGIIVSTILIGIMTYYTLWALHIEMPLINCFLFGALISPTDPIAVLGIMKKANVAKQLETKIVGESLFNDGVGVVVFLTIYEIAQRGIEHITLAEVGLLLLEEVAGGIILGLILGYVAYRMMRSIDDYSVEVMITLAVATGGYVLAQTLHFSGPLTVVVAGLLLGHDRVRESSMSAQTELYIDKFWETTDALLNGTLFVMIGLEILIIPFSSSYLIAGLIGIVIALLARYLSIFLPVHFYKNKLGFAKNTDWIMTWGGLRGGISIALALSLSLNLGRPVFIVITYTIVIFSIIVQGLTVGKLAKKLS